MKLALDIVRVVDHYRWVLLVSLVPVLMLSLLAARDVGVDNAVDVWFVDDDPALARYRGFQDHFGNDEVVALAVINEDGVLTVDGLAQLDAITRAAATVPGIAEVTSLTNVVHIRAAEGQDPAPPVVGPLIDALPGSASQAQLLRSRALSDPLVVGSLVNEDATAALVLARLESGAVPPVSVADRAALRLPLPHPLSAGRCALCQ